MTRKQIHNLILYTFIFSHNPCCTKWISSELASDLLLRKELNKTNHHFIHYENNLGLV